MRIRLLCLEDGITACGFRKMAAYAERLNADTESCFVTTRRYRSIRNAILGTRGAGGSLLEDEVDEIAHGLLGSDLIGFSSMTGYADLTRRVASRVRELDPSIYLLWGGIHPIIHPEDAILADVDAICTGEGEFAFEELLGALREGRDPTAIRNFWFRDGEQITRNPFLPLMSAEEMEELPFPMYRGERERVYRPGEGFQPMRLEDYVANDGVSYTAIWSIGCPFHCTYCGNTKFIANDRLYKRIRHPSARYMVDQIKDVRRRSPHVGHVSFQDDSFMAISYPQLEEFAERWKAELDIPFAVYGVIPNYVKQDKFEILTWAGMNRVRMGIQSGSQRILDFYKRPSPPAKILGAGEVMSRLSRYHLPPVYDIIMDNPIETRQDVVDTLELMYEMPRPYTLLTYSLKVIPNTDLEREMKAQGVDLAMIDDNYAVIPPRAANLLLYVLCLGRPPRRLWTLLLRRARASAEPQKLYPRIGLALRTLYLIKRMLAHVRRVEFSIMPGWTGYALWRVGLTRLWWRHFTPRLARPPRPEKWAAPASPSTLPVDVLARASRIKS